MSNQGYSKNQKLKHRKKIAGLFESRQSVRTGLFRVLYRLDNTSKTLEIGVAVPKRNIRKAVDRNRIKRLMRECIRKKSFQVWNAQLPNAYAELMFVYQGNKGISFARINEEINECFTRLENTSKTYEKI
jgi:ribonuclease P protein component